MMTDKQKEELLDVLGEYNDSHDGNPETIVETYVENLLQEQDKENKQELKEAIDESHYLGVKHAHEVRNEMAEYPMANRIRTEDIEKSEERKKERQELYKKYNLTSAE
jgi:hypothetical protein